MSGTDHTIHFEPGGFTERRRYMFETFERDRKYIESKYHNPEEPFNPYNRMAYHGWEADKSTGLSVEEIKTGLQEIARKYKDASHEVQKARAVEYVLDHTRIDINEHDYFPLIYTWGREISSTTIYKWNSEVFDSIKNAVNKMSAEEEYHDVIGGGSLESLLQGFQNVGGGGLLVQQLFVRDVGVLAIQPGDGLRVIGGKIQIHIRSRIIRYSYCDQIHLG